MHMVHVQMLCDIKKRMWAIGELIVWIIYGILSLPLILIITRLIRKKKVSIKGLIYLVIALMPLFLFGYNMYIKQRKVELNMLEFII